MTGRARLAIDAVRPLRHAVEIRNETFIDPVFVQLLRRHRVALVIADTGGLWPQPQDITADFVYLRLHGATELYKSRYSEEMLADWAARIRAWAAGDQVESAELIETSLPRRIPRDIYCYFDNTDKLHAPDNAQRLAQLLGRDWLPTKSVQLRSHRAARASP